MTTKRTDYRLRNGTQYNRYNRSLVNRGSLTLWIEEGIQDEWLAKDKTGTKGAHLLYTDGAIRTCLSLGIVLKLPLRQSIGLVRSLFARADGTYDSWENDADLAARGIAILIPSKKGSVIRQRKQAGVVLLPRDERLRAIRALGGGRFRRSRTRHK